MSDAFSALQLSPREKSSPPAAIYKHFIPIAFRLLKGSSRSDDFL
jgi:hypothetical protein